MVAQICEYTKNEQITCFKWMNCMICELYLQKKKKNCYKKKSKEKLKIIHCEKLGHIPHSGKFHTP